MSAPESAIGLHVGSNYIKVVRLVRRAGGPRLVNAEAMRLPRDRENLVDVIHRFLESKKLLHYPCAVCPPEFSSMLHTVDIAENDPRSEKDVASIEIHRLNDLSEEEMLYDFVKLPERSARRSILLAMGREAAIRKALDIPDAIGLEVVCMTPMPVAVYNGCMAHKLRSHGVVVCAHIGLSATHVAIGTRQGLLFTRRFDGGGDLFTRAIAKSLNVSEREAEDLKLRHGFSLADVHPDADLPDALRQAADTWWSGLEAALESYGERSAREAGEPYALVLSGGGAELEGFRDHIAGRTTLEVLPFAAPWSGRVPEGAGRFAVAGGLAMAALQGGRVPLNLLPTDRQDALRLRSQIPYWKTMGVSLALAVLIGIGERYVDYRRKQTQAQAIEARLQTYAAMERERQTLSADNARLVNRLRFAHRGMRDGMILRAIVGEIARVMDPEDWLILVADAKSYFGLPTPAPQPARSAARGKSESASSPYLERIIIEGYTPHEDFATVKSMIEKLRAVPYVENVDLLTDDRVIPDPERDQEWQVLKARLFAVEIEIRQP